MKICVIGTGYVGLVAGACLAEMGNSVICVDNDTKKLEDLKKGIISIYEPGLEEIIKNNTKNSRLVFSSDLAAAVQNSLVCFIAVGTPQDEEGSADMTYVYQVADEIGRAINDYKVIVNKSTVPPGSAQTVQNIIKKYYSGEFDVVSNPEFLKQGNAVEDFLRPDRVIIGSNSERALKIMREIYTPFLRSGNPLIEMNTVSSEMSKYAANSFLATKISFINQIANICETLGADIDMVRRGMCSDKRISKHFLYAGLGYGGSCFPKDVKALIKTAHDNNCNFDLLKSVDNVNKLQRQIFIDKILKRFNGDIKNMTFGVWGLAFKPETNDMREAPSITIINALLDNGAKVKAYDPKAFDLAKTIFQDKITYSNSSYEALEDADCMLLLTEWREFRNPDFEKIKSLLKNPLIFDGRNQYNIDTMKQFGFEYYPIGKKPLSFSKVN